MVKLLGHASKLQFAHVTMGFFETIDTIGVAMVTQVRDFLCFYSLLEKLIAIMKDEGGNFSTLAQTLASVVSCILLALSIIW